MNKQAIDAPIYFLRFPVYLSLVFASANVYAAPVYKSVDVDGNVTYSSISPKDATQTEKMSISAKGQTVTENQDNSNIERIKNLAGEMEKERIQRQGDREAANKKREQARAKKQAEEAKKQAEQKAAEPQDRYYPVYVPRPRHRPDNPGRPHPEHQPH